MRKISALSAAVMGVVLAASATGANAAEQIDVAAALQAAQQAQAAAEAAQAAALKAQAAAEAAQAKAEAEAARAQALADASATSASSAEAAATKAAETGGELTAAAWKPSFDFHGYFRSGVQKSRHDGGVKWQVDKVGRLGNENDTYSELEFGSEVYKVNDVSFYIDSMLQMSSNGLHDSEETAKNDDQKATFALRQFNLQIKGLIPNDPNATIWAGKRYYQRADIHIIDSKYLNIAGPGAGIEYLDVGPGELSLAWIRKDSMDLDYRYDDMDDIDALDNVSNLNVNYVDARYASNLWAGGWGQLAVAVAIPDSAEHNVVRVDGSTAASGTMSGDPVYDNGTSVMITAEVSQSFDGGYNKTVLQYMNGGLAHNAIDIGGGWYDSWHDAEDAYGFSIINTGEWKLTDRFSFTHVLHYGYAADYGNDMDYNWDNNADNGNGAYVYRETQNAVDKSQVFSAVARTSYQLTQYFRWLNEVGFFVQKSEYKNDDYVGSSGLAPKDGTFRGQKYTTALAIAPDTAILSRPELRFYVSYLHSSDSRDIGSGYGTATYGDNWMFGVQAEAWW